MCERLVDGDIVTDGKAKTICIVDDDRDVRDSLRVILQSYGYATRCHASGVELLHEPGAENADCLLLDLNMPGMSGIELLEVLRSRGIATPAIVLTANGERLGARLTRAGVVAVLRKPVADDVLLQWIDKACTREA